MPTFSPPHEPTRRHAATISRVATVGLVAMLLAGCQTPNTAATVAPPATGMIGQPAQYGSWATPPQGAAYPPTASAPPGMAPPAMQTPPPMPGPATQWQSASPTTQPAPNSWSWTQPSSTPPPSLQQYGQQLQNQAGQAQQSVTAQTQQYANQLQAQPQQWANQAQQAVTNQQQQLGQQLQNTANQYQQGFNGQVQAAQQQVTAQMPQYQQPAAANSWNPFSTSASSMPPARATPPTALPKY